MGILREAGKTQERKQLSIVVGCAAALLSLVLLGIVGENGYLERRAQRREIQALSAEIEKIQQENQQLGQTIQDLRSDPHAIEELARERLRLGRPGEVIVTLPREEPQAATVGSHPAP